MKFLIVVWMIIITLLGIFGTIHANDTDKNRYFKINWCMLLMFIIFPLTPVVAHFCGLI